VLLCRHGETDANAKGIIQGAGIDPPLNGTGRAQAERLGAAVQSVKLGLVVSSCLKRAKTTAQLVAQVAGHRGEVVEHADLNEMAYGDLEGKVLRDVMPELKAVSKRWAEGDHDHGCPGGGETPNEVLERGLRGLRHVLETHQPRDAVLVVGHSRFNKVLLSHLTGKPMHRLPQDNACVNVISYSHDTKTFVVEHVNLAADVLTAEAKL
ncbi:Uncharacterized phosphatase PhoE, partial [Durusdinium trenchii]